MTTIQDQYRNDYTLPGPFRSVAEIKRVNSDTGKFFFESSTMRFFKSRISNEIFGGRIFVTSEKGPNGTRAYTIRIADDSGAPINTSKHGFQAFSTLAQAKSAARRLVA